MLKIDKPQNFHFQMKIRAEKVDKSYRVICPCQSTTKKGMQGMQLSSVRDHSQLKKETTHTRWVANLKIAIASTQSVIGITELNGYWKHKYLFNTKRMTVFVFFPREQPNPCVLTYTITPSNDLIPLRFVDLIPLPPLVPTFLNEIAEKLEMVSDILEPQEGNLDSFLLVSQARQTLMKWNDDATSSSGESLHSLQPLELPQLQRSETTSIEEESLHSLLQRGETVEIRGDEEDEEEEEQDDDVPIQTSSTEVKPVPSSTNDDKVNTVATSSNASACADDSIADRVKQRKAKLIEIQKKEEEGTKDDERLKQWREKRKEMALKGIFIDADLDDNGKPLLIEEQKKEE